jgi:hypothetical protein
VAYVKSTDGGNTWSGAVTVASQVLADDTDPNNGALLRTGNGLPIAAINPVNGEIAVAWTDARFTGGAVNQVVISTSSDAGGSWSGPAVVSTTTPTNRAAFTVNLAFAATGTLAATYYDLRDLSSTNTSTLPTNLWAKVSTDGGATFGPDIHLAGPFNDLVAPFAGGYMLGDYSGLAAGASSFEPFFIQTNCSDFSCTADRTDVFTTSF